MELSSMDFARQQRDPTKHMIGIVFVVLIHVLVIYALMTGLARTVVEVIKKPLSATIIEELKAPPPPPPPPKKIVEMPKVQTPVETYVPPPDIPVAAAPAAPVISAVTATPPTAAPRDRPAGRRGAAGRRRRRSPRYAGASFGWRGDDPVYPRQAIRAGIAKGRVLARVMIDEKGNVTEVDHRVGRSAAALRQGRRRRAAGLEVQGRRREVRRRNRGQLHPEGLTSGTTGPERTASPGGNECRRFAGTAVRRRHASTRSSSVLAQCGGRCGPGCDT